ncbi:TMV resistance protein N [Morella rubra]|uniref:TMV resistance protein N n=1 Tax=Morella rubra TaxID=262757 RepID=A0A6A1WQE2_9ROSI|nr:TMV resistance protein N [Morella rubra]
MIRYECRFIDKIVEEVFCKVKPVHLDVAIHPIGMKSRVEQMETLLHLGANDVRIVGIYGMAGIGKTTIAKAVYNQICDGFEGSSCLLNIKANSEQSNGLVHLQEQVLFDILKLKDLNIGSIDEGITLIEDRIRGKRVLVILDDVDDLRQIYSLVGHCEWFGPGSRVIATTRDEHLLTQLRVNGKYEVKQLDQLESLQLFSWHAFQIAHPVEGFRDLSTRAVEYAGGLPLALEVLGSFLSGRSVIEWETELKILQKAPPNKIQKILRVSFDSLEDDRKFIFLDIACFFIGWEKEYVIKVLDACGFSSISGIRILIQSSLLRIDGRNKLTMHDLIRDMGGELVREESPRYPGKRSRLWCREDVFDVLNKHTGSGVVEGLILGSPPEVLVEGLILHPPPSKVNYYFKTEAFTHMKNLRLLQIDDVNLTGSYEYLSKELRWLCWQKCPLEFLPQHLYLENLVVLDMRHSNVKQIWKKNRMLYNLKVLNLGGSENLIKLPCFSQVPHLEILILEGCTNLALLHESIGHLKELVFLNLKNCVNLRNLPRSISQLKSLETLNLSGCRRLHKLPQKLGDLTALKELLANGTAIKRRVRLWCWGLWCWLLLVDGWD